MDINCGDIITERGEHRGQGARDLRGVHPRRLGGRTKSEELGFGGAEFVPWQIGAVM